MAYSMIHLEVAYRLLNKWDWIKNPGDFLVGAVAPDAVHFCENYQIRMKEKSHIWDCGPRWGITEDPDKWESDVMRFWEENKDADNKDFIAGYCVHILTDIHNALKIWKPFQEENIKGTNVEEAYHIYGKEAYESDQWLYQTSPHSKKIIELLASGSAYPIEDCIGKEEIEKKIQYMLREEYGKTEIYDIRGFRYCNDKVILGFIEECTDWLAERLK